ncbi:MAG: sulfatase-like hydrolase/transferase [Rikenellaceae bacterium]
MNKALVISAIFAPAVLSAATRPNIIFLLTDDQHFNTMGCWGGDVLTPAIDRLAAEGVKFTRAYTASSVSSPSRYSILSGRYSGRCSGEQFEEAFPLGTTHRIDNTTLELEDDMPNVAKLLQEAGYTTGMVGKWHIGHHFKDPRDQELRRAEWEKIGLKYYDKTADPRSEEVEEALRHNHDWYSNQIKKQGFDYADNIYWANLKEVYSDALNYHNIDWSVEGAIDFMDQAGDRPFFLYFSTTLHHGPTPQRSLPDEYQGVTSKGFAHQEINTLPARETLFERLKAEGIDQKEAYTLWLDDAVGALMQYLEDSGQAENTIIFYLSDHGIDQKSSMYEGGIHIPLMVWGAGVEAKGTECDRLIHTCDLTATALEVAGVEKPAEPIMDGSSMLPLLREPHLDWRRSLYSEIGYARCVVTDRYKYIAVRYPDPIKAKFDRGFTTEEQSKIGYIANQGLCALGKTNPNYFAEDQLYDIKSDPMERNNLAADPNFASTMSQMRELMECYLSKFVGRPFYDLYDGVSATKEFNAFDALD